MTEPNDTAFPVGTTWGLTKREYFAIMVLQGIANPEHSTLPFSIYNPEPECQLAVRYADALIAELNKEEKS